MGGKGGSPPPAPNYIGAAQAQGAASREIAEAQTVANRPAQFTPWGRSQWESFVHRDPATGEPYTRWRQTVALPDVTQEALEAQQRVERLRSLLGESLSRRAVSEYGAPIQWDPLAPGAAPTSNFSAGNLGPETLEQIRGWELAPGSPDTGELSSERLRAETLGPEGPTEPFQPGGLPLVTPGGRFGPEALRANQMVYQSPQGGLGPETWQGLTPAQLSPFGWGGLSPNEVQAARMGAMGPTGVRQEAWGGLDPNAVRGAEFQTLEPTNLDTPESFRARAEEAIYNRMTSRLGPRLEQERQALYSRLWNQGLRPGEEAWDAAMGNFDRQRTDAYQAAMDEATLAGRVEAESMFGMDLSRRQQAMGEAAQAQQMEMARRGMAAGEYGAGFERELARRQQLAAESGQAFQEELARRQQAEAEFGAGFGRQMAQRELAGSEAQDLFARELARRQQGVGEAERAYELGLAGRGQYTAEEQDIFAREAARRQQNLAEAESQFGMRERAREWDLAQRQQQVNEAAQRFQQGLTGRQQFSQELQDIYGREMGRRQQIEAERQAEFGREATREEMERAQSADWFQRELARQQQYMSETEARFGMAMTQRQQALAEEMQRRGWSLNEISAILSGQQIGMPGMPSYQRAGRGMTPDLLGAAQNQYQAGLNAYNAQQMQQQGLWSGLMGAASMAPGYAFAFSDRRLKSDIERVGTTPGGQPLYAYIIFGRPQIGVMADESPPHVVWRHPSGFLMVDYSRIR